MWSVKIVYYWPLNILYLYRSYELFGDICAFLCIRLLLFQLKKKQIQTEYKQKKEKEKINGAAKHQHVITFVISIDYESYKWPAVYIFNIIDKIICIVPDSFLLYSVVFMFICFICTCCLAKRSKNSVYIQ